MAQAPCPLTSRNHDPTAGGLSGQTVLVIGGTRGIGLATARRARAAGAELVITGRNIEHLDLVGGELHARTAAFDATDFDRLAEFFRDLPVRSTTCLSQAQVRTTRLYGPST